MRVLTSPADTGAVTLAFPQDVQAEAYDFPEALFEQRVWTIARPLADRSLLAQAVEVVRASQRPLIVAGGGVLYSQATEALTRFVEQTGIPVGETQAGKGSLPYNHPQNMGAVGATGTLAANRLAHDADLVIGIGTRYSDFTTASKTAFQNPHVRFININTAEFDAFKHSAVPLTGDARAVLEELSAALTEFRVDSAYLNQMAGLKADWEAEVERLFHLGHQPLPAQSEVIGAIWESAGPQDVLVSAAGSHPGDFHKLWRAHTPNSYHMEYGYSCMGYEIPGAMGVKAADPSREVYVFVGDGTYLMMPSEIVTSVQEGYKLTIVLLDNAGFKSIGALSRSLGQEGFGTRFIFRQKGVLSGDDGDEGVQTLPLDLAANARSLGAHVIECETFGDFTAALEASRSIDQTTVIYICNDRYVGVPGYDSWWDVVVAEVSDMPGVQEARKEWEEKRATERYFL
jgi:3D-(3,5/4)-trihydroxycyclohexane-1,2-dione acylhydrolase (decyclizing)